jgi:hypothetical protein
VAKLGFVSALRAAIDPPPPPLGPWNHSKVVPYAEGLTEETVLCEKCKHPMKKNVVYEWNIDMYWANKHQAIYLIIAVKQNAWQFIMII